MATTIFLDIDGTLIDLNQRPTVDGLPALVATLQSKGCHFGLNSNRAKEDVADIITMFGLNGPFILENGAYILNSDGKEDVLTVGVEGLQSTIVELLKEFAPTAQVSLADTTKLYTTSDEVHTEGVAIFVNQFRKYTGSIHHRSNGVSTFAFATSIANYLNDVFAHKLPQCIAVAHEHGNSVTIESIGVNKATGCAAYRARYVPEKIIAIGDGSNDVVLKDCVDELYAVGNAVPELKAVSMYVSPHPVTQGVVDILKSFLL